MSKRVEVREGDKWKVDRHGVLYQVRGTQYRPVASTYVEAKPWIEGLDTRWHHVAPLFAKAAITGLGGEWAEVAEEKAATTTTKTLHLYAGPSTPASVFAYDGKLEQVSPGMKYLGTTTITIAEVTT